jgi:hypothetical protein
LPARLIDHGQEPTAAAADVERSQAGEINVLPHDLYVPVKSFRVVDMSLFEIISPIRRQTLRVNLPVELALRIEIVDVMKVAVRASPHGAVSQTVPG